ALRADSSACGRPRLLAVADQPGVSLIELIGSRNRLMSPLRPSPQPVPLLLVRKCSDLFAGLAPQAPRTPHKAVFMTICGRGSLRRLRSRLHRSLLMTICLRGSAARSFVPQLHSASLLTNRSKARIRAGAGAGGP